LLERPFSYHGIGRPNDVREEENPPQAVSHLIIFSFFGLTCKKDRITLAPLMSKTPRDSAVTMTEIVLPSDANALGTIFGGKILSWIDIAAAIAAGRHARKVVVTASIDALHFVAPVKVGHVVHIQAAVNDAGKTSMEVGVRVDSENPLTGERHHTATAYLTFVALDDHGRPTKVSPVLAETPEEKRRQESARLRRNARMALANEIKEKFKKE
jgi:acyl-CoA hydrolase